MFVLRDILEMVGALGEWDAVVEVSLDQVCYFCGSMFGRKFPQI